MNSYQIAGWFGAWCFALCSLPQVWQCYKDQHADGMSIGTLILWSVGEVLTVIYLFGMNLATPQLLFNYVLNLFGLIFIWYFKLCKRKQS